MTGLIHRDSQSLFRVFNSPNQHVFGGGRSTNPRRHGENKKLHTKRLFGLQSDSNPGPPCCVAMVLTRHLCYHVLIYLSYIPCSLYICICNLKKIRGWFKMLLFGFTGDSSLIEISESLTDNMGRVTVKHSSFHYITKWLICW